MISPLVSVSIYTSGPYHRVLTFPYLSGTITLLHGHCPLTHNGKVPNLKSPKLVLTWSGVYEGYPVLIAKLLDFNHSFL